MLLQRGGDLIEQQAATIARLSAPIKYEQVADDYFRKRVEPVIKLARERIARAARGGTGTVGIISLCAGNGGSGGTGEIKETTE